MPAGQVEWFKQEERLPSKCEAEFKPKCPTLPKKTNANNTFEQK
jgi:hypothetical protein